MIKGLLKREYSGISCLQPFVFVKNRISRVKKEIDLFDRSLLSSALKIVWRE
jgi:hypothetical protein